MSFPSQDSPGPGLGTLMLGRNFGGELSMPPPHLNAGWRVSLMSVGSYLPWRGPVAISGNQWQSVAISGNYGH